MSDQHSHGNHEGKEHGYYTGDIHNQFVPEHVADNSVKVIWKTFWILLFVTMFEVGIAFSSISKFILLIIFIVLTIVKAYYIIGYFMHLKHEKSAFGYSILLPFFLILYFVVMAIAEGNYLNFVK